MDIFEKLNNNLEPLEGDLFIDGFVEAVRGPVNQTVQEAQPQTLQTAFAEHGVGGGETVDVEPGVTSFGDFTGHEKTSDGSAKKGSETNRLKGEVEEFMNRDKSGAAGDEEIQEFLADRSGFDPSDFD